MRNCATRGQKPAGVRCLVLLLALNFVASLRRFQWKIKVIVGVSEVKSAGVCDVAGATHLSGEVKDMSTSSLRGSDTAPH